MLAFLAIWIARRLGVSFETETVAQTHILHFFTTNTPLSALSFFAVMHRAASRGGMEYQEKRLLAHGGYNAADTLFKM